MPAHTETTERGTTGNTSMRRLVFGTFVIVAAVGLSAGPAAAKAGDPTTHAEIAADTSCPNLQATFDTNAARNAVYQQQDRQLFGQSLRKVTYAYMKAAQKRILQLDCSATDPTTAGKAVLNKQLLKQAKR